ncbi:MAG TPA: UPF0182 family protein [Marmoricola sp.]|nr:UPF0182 family protein [Marmoricola sp.]
MNRRARIALWVGGSVCAAVICLIVLATTISNRLWFSSLGFAGVYDRELTAKATLFFGFGALAGVLVAANIALGFGMRPMLVGGPEPTGIARYRAFLAPTHRRSLVLVSAVVGIIAGWIASSHWLTLLMWRFGGSFGVKDPYFHRDAGFYVFDLPWWHFVTEFVMAGLLISFVAATAVHYLYGGLRLQQVDRHLTRAAGAHLAGLGAAILVLRALQIWLDRYDLLTRPGTSFSGMSYVSYHAVLPGQTLLAWFAVVCAVLLVVAAWRTQWLFSTVALCLYAVAILGIGVIWPAVMRSTKVDGHLVEAEGRFVAQNIAATRSAFGLNTVATIPGSVKTPDLKSLVGNSQIAAIRTDSQTTSPSLGLLGRAEVGYYVIDGHQTEVLLGVKRVAGKDVLTGAFANPAGAASAKTTQSWWSQAQTARYLDLTSESLTIDPVRSGYQVVTKSNASKGYSLSSWWTRAASAIRYADPDLFGAAGSSHLVDLRQPLQRVQRLAPWLTLDSQVYPAVVDGRVVWILDGYTTTADYPESQVASLSAMTTTSQNPRPTFGSSRGDAVNYLRDSVKVVVDASTGAVNLYAWHEDPILKAMRAAFPGLVQDEAAIPSGVRAVLRYPATLFDVQRAMFASYHDANPATFLSGANQWVTSSDAQQVGLAAPALRGLVANSSGALVPTLSATYVNGRGTATVAYLSVNTDSGSSEFGQIQVQVLPEKPVVDTSQNVVRQFEADTRVVALKKKVKTLIEGELLTVPVAGGVLQIETLYGSSVQPGQALGFVATFGGAIGYGQTLEAAIADIGRPQPAKAASPSSVQLVREANALMVKAQKEKNNRAQYEADIAKAQRLLQKALKDPAFATPTATPTASPTTGATK